MLSIETKTKRRDFLRGRFSPKHSVIRPPWAIAEAIFIDRCTRCNDCIAGCETGILFKGDGGYPEVDFAKGECTFCEACVNRCPTQALSFQRSPPWTLVARVSESCLAHTGVVCMTCRDQCPEQAILMQPRVGQPALPCIDEQLCTGCGACFVPCPTRAVQLIQINNL
ncbi:MAG: ferredoxin-type protein NapF [Gammaproteobacteria bacterium]